MHAFVGIGGGSGCGESGGDCGAAESCGCVCGCGKSGFGDEITTCVAVGGGDCGGGDVCVAFNGPLVMN